jgi:uncharacterized protein YodC (DUF2158 family)
MFEKGSKVQPKQGGPVMTVRRVADFSPISANGVDCVWFDEKHKRRSAIFDARALRPLSLSRLARDAVNAINDHS